MGIYLLYQLGGNVVYLPPVCQSATHLACQRPSGAPYPIYETIDVQTYSRGLLDPSVLWTLAIKERHKKLAQCQEEHLSVLRGPDFF